MGNGSGSVLPPDIREKMKGGSRTGGGIGSAAPENVTSARAREVAMNPDAVNDAIEEAASAAAAEEVKPELKVCPRCRKDLKDEWNFCSGCGEDLVREGPAKKLGIVWKETDLHDYIFKGYVVRDLMVLGKHKVTVKSSQPQDLAEIDDYIMNGDWAKNPDKTARNISDFYLRQINALCQTASSVQKFDGELIGQRLADRVKWFDERGSAFVDLVSTRVVLFNRALTDYLKKADSLSGF